MRREKGWIPLQCRVAFFSIRARSGVQVATFLDRKRTFRSCHDKRPRSDEGERLRCCRERLRVRYAITRSAIRVAAGTLNIDNALAAVLLLREALHVRT